MKTTDQISEVRKLVATARTAGKRVSFVPTMGYLHDGHLSLIEVAQQNGDFIVVSIFVNPAQFNNPADLEQYPRDTDRDLGLLKQAGVDLVFLPDQATIYPAGFQSWVEVKELTVPFEGEGRPGHFQGVATVLCTLFNIVQPDSAVFGEKDFQQLRSVEQMVSDLKFPLEIVRGPLVREEDGLAISSRNVRLSPEGRKRALALSRGLKKAHERFNSGTGNALELVATVAKELEKESAIKIFYLDLVDESDLSVLSERVSTGRILAAIEVDGVRLLDNIALTNSIACSS